MKELDSFTVERLEEIRNAFLDRVQESTPTIEEVFALINIALAAKRAEPIAWLGNCAYYNTERAALKDGVLEPMPLYTTPPLPAEPAAYADRKAFENFRNGTATKEWMWAAPDSGLIALYTTPQLSPTPSAWEVNGILCHTKEDADLFVGTPIPLYEALS